VVWGGGGAQALAWRALRLDWWAGTSRGGQERIPPGSTGHRSARQSGNSKIKKSGLKK